MKSNVAKARQQRKELAQSRKRLVFHSDGKPLERAIALSEGTAVTTCTYSLIHQFNLCRHYRTSVGQPWPPARDDPVAPSEDWLQTYVDFCRRNGLEAFWAMRMNDTHDAGDYEDARWKLNNNEFKQNHPECLVGAIDNQPPHGRWTSVNYGRAEVREQTFGLWQEVCEDYDIDGLLLDFFRHPTLFRSVTWGGQASQEELDMMTDLMRRARDMRDRIGAKRGRPIMLAIRTPDSVGYCKGMGIDLEKWMVEDLIDIWVAGGYFQLQSWQENAQLAHRYGAAVWASFDECRMRGSLPQLTGVAEQIETGIHGNPAKRSEVAIVRNSVESYHAQAASAWEAGVDGIYLFNFLWPSTDPHHALLNELDDPQRLADLDKMYCADVRGRSSMAASHWLDGGDRFYTSDHMFSPENPLELRPGNSQSSCLFIGDDLATAEDGSVDSDIRLYVQIEGTRSPDDLRLAFNDIELHGSVLSDVWLEYAVESHQLRRGVNRIDVSHAREGVSPFLLHDLQLWIKYHS